MSIDHLDKATSEEIDSICDQLLFDARQFRSPVESERVFACLGVTWKEIDLGDPTALSNFAIRVSTSVTAIVDVLGRLRIEALWLPDDSVVLVEKGLPAPKKTWALLHDLTHALLPWHREFFLGDTAVTLDPSCAAILESEANYGASALLFGGSRFETSGRSCSPEWASVKKLSKAFGASLTATLCRFVLKGPDYPMVGLVTSPWWKAASHADSQRSRHVVTSQRFKSLVGRMEPCEFDGIAALNTKKRRGGPAGTFLTQLEGRDGNLHVFRGESFFNGYDVLTLLVHERTHYTRARRSSKPLLRLA